MCDQYTATQKRFVSGSGIHGANLKGVCIQDTWADNQHRLAQIALTLGISNFEAWLAETIAILDVPTANPKRDSSRRRELASELQKPSGYANALARLNPTQSVVLTKCISPALAREHQKAVTALPALIAVFRHFKDLRNKMAHEGGLADTQVVTSYANIAALTPADLEMSEVPATAAVVLNDPITLQLRGVVGLTGVVLRIVRAFDYHLSNSLRSELHLIERWKAEWGTQGAYQGAPLKRRRSIARKCVQLGLPPPEHLADLDAFLQSHLLGLE